MSTPSIKVGQGNWGIKALNLLGYANTDKKFVARDFTVGRLLDTATRVNASGNIEVVNANVPRIDYFGGQASLLVEPSAVNGIRNNSMVGASAPNTLPNNWSNAGSNLTRQSVVTGTLNGIPYVDVRVSGTANNAFHDIFWDASNIIAASVGQNWVASCYLQIIAQPNPPVNYVLAMREFSSGGTFLGVFQGSALSISTTSFNRFSFTRALNQATVAFVHPSLFFTLVNGQTYDFTIRIGYPQMEQSSVATSVIPTTTGSVTRNADAISVTGVAGLIGQTEGTIYVEVDYRNFSTETQVIIQSLTDTQNRIAIQVFRSGGNNVLQAFAVVSNSQVVSITYTIPSAGVYKIAFAYKLNDYQLFVNSVDRGADITAGVPAMNTIQLGHFATVAQFNDRIRAVSIYQTRLPNTTTDGSPSLQSITTL